MPTRYAPTRRLVPGETQLVHGALGLADGKANFQKHQRAVVAAGEVSGVALDARSQSAERTLQPMQHSRQRLVQRHAPQQEFAPCVL